MLDNFNYRSFIKGINLVIFFTILNNCYAITTVWQVLSKQCNLNHEINQPEVQKQLHWLLQHPAYLQKLTQSEPYIYHILTEIKKRNLPGELALIPMIESAYNPFAYSGAGAAGLWQLMPRTGNHLGIKQDWWFDGRRSVKVSTQAALKYLAYLNKYFQGNWLLAIAAYDSGLGTILRAIKSNHRSNSKNINFWSLQVPNETQKYIPKLLALAEIIKNPDHYNVHLPKIPHVPYFAEVNIGSQIDLTYAAKLAEMPYKDLIKLNPGYNRWTTPPYKPFNLLLPINNVAKFNANLINRSAIKYFNLNNYQIDKKDLTSMQKKFSTVNSSPYYKVLHIVQPGENYQDLITKYKVTAAKLRQWNNLESKQFLQVGQQLTIWKRTQQYYVYTIKNNDTLNRIAQTYNTTVASIIKLNPNIKQHIIFPGQKLIILF